MSVESHALRFGAGEAFGGHGIEVADGQVDRDAARIGEVEPGVGGDDEVERGRIDQIGLEGPAADDDERVAR